MRKLILILALLTNTLSGFAQTGTVYRRTVVDTEARPLEYFNVTIANPQDSTYLRGDTYLGGKLEMRHNFSGPHLVTVQCLGYEDLTFVEDFSAPMAPDTIVMRTAAIRVDAVRVAGRVPSVTTSRGKTVVRVAGSMLQNLPEVSDILRRAPSLRVEDGGISVFGKGMPQIFLDGRESSYDEIQMLQPSQIVSIEVDSNPSARYDASYSSVVRVKTNRASSGTSGQIANHAYMGRRYSNSTTAQLQVATGRWVNYFSYGYSDHTLRNYSTDTEAIHLDSSPLSDTIFTDQLSRSRSHAILYGSMVDIARHHQLSWQYKGSLGRDSSRDKQQERLRRAGNLQNIDAQDIGSGRSSSHSANLRYHFAIDSLRAFEVTADYANSAPRGGSTITRHYLESDENDVVTIGNHSRANVFSAKAEYTTPLWGMNLLGGVRYGHINSRTTTLYNDSRTVTRLRNDNFAVYATLADEYKKWGWSAGVRGEFLKDDIRTDEGPLRDGWMNNVFPSAEIYTSELSKHIDLALSYTSRVQRPTVRQLDPAASYVNSVVTSYGNPLLLLMVSHNLEFVVTLFSDLTLTFGANYDLNPSIDAGELSADGKSIAFKPLNVPCSRTYLIQAAYTNTWGPFSLTASGEVEFPRTRIPYLGETIIVGKPSWGASVDVDLKLAKNTSLTAGFQYYGRGYALMTVMEPANNLTAGITQYLFDRRLQLSLSGYDLLRGGVGGGGNGWRDRYGFYETSQRPSYDTRRVRLTVRWLFNNYKARYREQGRSQEYERIN